MSDLARSVFGDDAPAKPLAVVVDLDDTVCTGFDCPIRCAVDVLARIDRQRVTVHYVTARTDVSRTGTDRFIMDHRLPGWRHVHYCPKWQGSKSHKAQVHVHLVKEYRVIASIGDLDEEEGEAARLAGVPFVRVDRSNPVPAWAELEKLLDTNGAFGTPTG
jgi:predicted secreted acid phosphatase